LDDEHAVHPAFTAPDFPQALTFDLTVDDGFGGIVTDSVTINVENDPPVADAGPAQSVGSNAPVTLDGTGSSDPDGHSLTYAWSQVSGPTVTVTGANTAHPSFTTPVGPTTLSFLLTVDDGHGGLDSDTVSVAVAGIPGLDLSNDLTGTIKGEINKSVFQAKVTNVETGTRTVNQSHISATVTVNGVPVSPSSVVVTAKSISLKPGKSTIFAVTWTHGASLQAGDAIAVAVCANFPGDEHPGNNCDTVDLPSLPIDLSTTLSVPVVHKPSLSNKITVTVHNNGTEYVTPLRSANLTVTVQVDEGTPKVLTLGTNRYTLKPGKTLVFPYAWSHAKLPPGSHLTVTACLNVPGNTSTEACQTVETTTVL
jgi:hypothetical protein